MSFTFNLNLDKKPLVLCGPILRAVSDKSVTVWLALQAPATVRLSVKDQNKTEVLFGSLNTCAVGRNLHIVAVTANQFIAGVTKLDPEKIYTYDIAFTIIGATKFKAQQNLIEATNPPGATSNLLLLGYGVNGLPSFCLPPTDVNKLRLIHGSCRHPNGTGGKDALALLSGLISETANDPLLRPHQLFLTGDQIYADDVAPGLLMLLTSAADQLLGWQELLNPPQPPPRPGNQLLPYMRTAISKAIGLTSDAASSHLYTLGEYICMYLFVWADVLWTADDLPNRRTVSQALLDLPASPDNQTTYALMNAAYAHVDDENTAVRNFRATLADVRKALANIPTYMILDDHEITDDFHLHRRFCENVYGSMMGPQVIRNGLVAYALCQHWGNDPASFIGAATPGGKLLAQLNNGNASTYLGRSSEISRLVGVNPLDKLRAPPEAPVGKETKGIFAVYHDLDALKWNYVVDFPTHQVIVTDSRTWRAFPNGDDEAGELMTKDQIQKQIVSAAPETGDKPLFVVLSTNAPPSPIIRFGERNPWIARRQAAQLDNDPEPDLWDSWELPSPPLERLFAALSERVPLKGKVRRGSAILLSGDVHSSSASRLLFSGAARFEDVTAQPVHMVIAQLISSSLRNQTDKTLKQDKKGYNYWQPGTDHTIAYVGWNLGKDVEQLIAQSPAINGIHFDQKQKGPGARGPKELDFPVVRQPDYAYRLDLLGVTQERVIPDFAKQAVPAGATPAAAAEKFKQVSANYRGFVASEHPTHEMIGRNNLSEVNLEWDKATEANRKVFQTVRWVGSGGRVILSRYVVSLNPDDASYKLKTVIPPLGWTGPLGWAP